MHLADPIDRFLKRTRVCTLAATASLLAHTPLSADPLDDALSGAVSDLDHLLAQDDTPRPGAAPAKDIPPLDTLIAPDIMPPADKKPAPTEKVIEGEAGVLNIYGQPAATPAPAAAAPEPKPEAAPVPTIQPEPAPAVAPAYDGIISAGEPAEETGGTVSLPPALNTLPKLPPINDPAESEAALFNNPDGSTGGVQSSSISTNFAVNLVQKLVQSGVLSQADGQELVRVAQVEAEMAQQHFASQSQAPVAPDGTVRVTYVPEVVKKQIRDEVRADVMAQAQMERWAAPGLLPDWVNGVEPFGDVRLRYEYSRFPEGNDNTGAFPNFNSINTGSPFDVSGLVFSPQYNVDQDRQRFRLRARIGAEFLLEESFSAGIRLATGESNSPTSPNQSLGASGGNFSKYAIWIDRAFIKYEIGGDPDRNVALLFGRFDNPFFNTDIIWDDDLGFDGLAFKGRYEIVKGVTPFVAGGFFPVYNTEFSYATNQPAKFESEDKWMWGAQIGIDWKITEDIKLKLAASYYDFHNIEGRLSTPYIPLSASDAGDTDATRPSFAQKGNTYRPLRNIIASPLNDYGTSMQYQYFGLASPYREVAYTGRLEIDTWEPYQIALIGEFVQNLDFDQDAIDAVAVNNRGVSDFATGAIGRFEGGDTAWFAGVQIGKGKFEKRWDWNATAGYRYVESDAVVDAFADSDFGGGGTNMQGYVIGASVALSPSVRLGLRYMTADEIAGPPLKSDIIQIDLNAKF
jgi:hypothetical protein